MPEPIPQPSSHDQSMPQVWGSPGDPLVENPFDDTMDTGGELADQKLISTYDPSDQFTVEDLNREYPEWKDETGYEDPELAALAYIRTQNIRDIAQSLGISPSFATGEGLDWVFKQMTPEVGMRFDAHGIAGKSGSAVNELDALLTEGLHDNQTFYTMNFIDGGVNLASTLGAAHPFTEGGLIVVSDVDTMINETGIKYVVVGEEYMNGMDILTSKYPDYTFVPWNEAPNTLANIVNEKDGSDIQLTDSSEEIFYERRYELGGSAKIPSPAMPTVELVEIVESASGESDDPDVW